VADAQQREGVGERVRWGGELVSTTPGGGNTCFEVVSKPLDERARPRSVDESFGRFIACAPGFYDPAIYAPRRDVTVVGTLEPAEPGKVGDADYTFPRLRADAVYLWPKLEPGDLGYYPYWYPYGWGWGGPWWGWGGPWWWGWGIGRGWGGGVIRVR
jgi:outer membrane lipoprotein